jgi:hypothetical protein
MNEFGRGLKVRGSENTYIYIIGNGHDTIQLYALGGNITLSDATLNKPYITPTFDAVSSLNLRNVVIREGGWEDLVLKGGQWENVQIYPPVDITNATIENVIGYNVTFPEGNPWTGQPASNISMTMVNTPFQWEEVKVPTPEELGLIWEMPVITGAPRGK